MKTKIKPIEYLTSIECFGGGSIAIHRSEGGLPILRVHDKIASEIVAVEIRDTAEVGLLIDALNEFYVKQEEKA